MNNFGNFKDLNDLIEKIEPISGKRLMESVEADSMSEKTADVVVPKLPDDKFVSRKAAGNTPEPKSEEPQLGSADTIVEGDVRGMGPTTGLTVLYVDKDGNHPSGKTWTQYSRIQDPQHLYDAARKHQQVAGEARNPAVGFLIVQLDKNGRIEKEFHEFSEIPDYLKEKVGLTEAFDDKKQVVDESPMDSAQEEMNTVDKVMDRFNDIFDKKFNPKSIKFDVDSTKQHLEVSDKEITKIPRGWRNV